MLNKIIEKLQKMGYEAEIKTNIKNGIACTGIMIATDSNICPVIYTDTIIERAIEYNKTIDEIVSMIIDIYNNSKSVNIDTEILRDRDFVLKNLYIALQKESSEEELVKENCEELAGIEKYVYCRAERNGETFSFKMSKPLLENLKISEEIA